MTAEQAVSKIIDVNEITSVLDRALARYPDPTGRVLNVLNDVLSVFRYIPIEALEQLSHRIGIPLEQLLALCDCFRDFSLEPVGKYLVEVCNGTACHTRNAPEIISALENALGIKEGQTTEDGRFTLRAVHCVGACGLAPVVVVEGQAIGRVRLSEVNQVIKVAD